MIACRQDDWKMRKLRLGLCTRCGKERLESATLGPACLAAHRDRMARMRVKARSFRRYRSDTSEALAAAGAEK